MELPSETESAREPNDAAAHFGFSAKLISFVLVAFSLLYCLGFLSIYSGKHVYQRSSEWISKNIPPQAKILGVEWDDFLPLSLPDQPAGGYLNRFALPLYNAPGTQSGTFNSILTRLAGSDYLIFPTQRIPGSIPRVPNEYKDATALLRQLYSGQLGYRLVKTFKDRPFSSYFYNDDDEADESFSVYDHPKVAVFKNELKLDSHELLRRVASADTQYNLPDLSQILRAESSAAAPLPLFHTNSIFQLLAWLIALEILAWASLPMALLVARNKPFAAFGIARVGGPVVLGFLSWWANYFHLIAFDARGLWLLTLLIFLSGFLAFEHRHGSLMSHLKSRRSEIGWTTAIWYGAFFLFLLLRAFRPEIFWGEKPMDFTFLNYFLRLDYAPATDPWAAGQSMRYYYLGWWIWASVHKLALIVATPVGYNLALATLGSSLIMLVFSCLRLFSLPTSAALVGSYILVLSSNFEVLRLLSLHWGKALRPFDDIFWPSTRLFTSPAFTEYPIWALIFGDLHAHVMALPISVLAIICTFLLLTKLESPLLSAALAGVVFGALFFTNSWDLLTYGLLFGLALLFLTRANGVRISSLATRASVLALFLLPTIWVFFFGVNQSGMSSAQFGAVQSMLPGLSGVNPLFWLKQFISGHLVQGAEFNTLSEILRHFGTWIIVAEIGAWSLVLLNSSARAATPPALRILLCLVLSFVPLALGALNAALGVQNLPWGILALATSWLMPALLLLTDAELEFEARFAALLLATAGLLIPFAELYFVMDRMNTIFKFFNQVWYLLGIGSLTLAFKAVQSAREKVNLERYKFCSGVIAIPATLALATGVLGGVALIVVMLPFRRVPGPRPTLDGGAYLTVAQPEEAQALRWLKDHVSGTPVLLEAHGPSYREFGRVAMHTGLPIVLGWDYHVQQRGTPEYALALRKRAVNEIYTTLDSAAALEAARGFNVELIVVGQVERATYPALGLQKFDDHPDLFPLLFKNGKVSIYTTNYSNRNWLYRETSK